MLSFVLRICLSDRQSLCFLIFKLARFSGSLLLLCYIFVLFVFLWCCVCLLVVSMCFFGAAGGQGGFILFVRFFGSGRLR